MRDIKFRGKTVTGEWVYGNLAIVKTNQMRNVKCGTYISNDCGMPFAYQVIPETVGQFTGLRDIAGNKLYEGDRILSPYHTGSYKILYEDGAFWIVTEKEECGVSFLNKFEIKTIQFEAIGSIHD